MPDAVDHRHPFLAGGGEMGARMRAHDWAATPLGAPGTWPEALRTMVSTVINSALLGTVLWGPELRMLYNDAYAPALGERHPHALGRPLAEVWADIWGFLAPSFLRALHTGEPHFETRFPLPMTRGGRLVTTYWNYSVAPIRDGTGAVVGLLNQALDVTAEVHAENALRQSERRQRDLLQQMPGFVGVTTGPDHVYEYVNDAFVAVFGPRQFIGRRVREVFPEIEGQGFFELLDEVYATGEPYSARSVPFRLAGETRDRFTDFTYQPIRDDDGAVTGIFVGGYEVTEQHRAAQALRELNADLERKVTERALARGRTWQVSPDLLVVINHRGIFEVFNPAWTTVLGWSEEELTGVAYARLVHPDDQTATQAVWLDAVERGLPALRFENRYRHKDGTWRWLSWVGVPDDDKVYCSARDVTVEKEQATALLQRTRERDRAWHLSRELLVVALPDGTLEAVNPLWTALLGWTERDLIGSSFAEYTHPDDLDATLAAFAGILERPLTVPYEYRFRHRDGTYRWFAWTGVSADGKVYATGRDLSAEKEQAESLRLSRARAATYFDFSEDYLFLVRADADGSIHFEDMNPACERVMGLTRADVAGRRIDGLVPADSAGDIGRYARLCLATHQPQTYLAVREYRNGHKVIIEGRTAFVERREDGGGLVLFSGRDVTEQRGTEDALRQSQKMEAVGQLTGGVAHDFNNLLTVIKSSSDLLKRPDLTEERRTRYVAAISDTVDRAAKLTGQLLAFARRQALKPEVFAACDGVRGLADMMRTLTGSRVRITTDLPAVSCFVNADASQFDTALVNLAVNARDAMDGEGGITIKVQAVEAIPAIRTHAAVNGPYVAVSLSDTGTGIPSDVIERIFEPFFTTKEVGKGTGLGLSQVFGFAKQSGGDVTVASTPGGGTTFTLYLPRVAAPDQAESAEDTESLVDGSGTRVLVVEDNVEVGSFAVQTLSDLGYTPTLAADGPAALAELAKDPERFDVVFSDVMMPGMSGIELGQEIRRLYHDLPVVLTSGYSHVLAQNGTYGFELLHKPYSVEQLSQMLRKAAGWQRRKRLPGH